MAIRPSKYYEKLTVNITTQSGAQKLEHENLVTRHISSHDPHTRLIPIAKPIEQVSKARTCLKEHRLISMVP